MVEIQPDSEETCRQLAALEAGEDQAFDAIFARHRPWLRRLIQLRWDDRLRSRLDPSDIVQEAQLESFQRLADFLRRRPMPFRLWLRKTLEQRLRMAERQHLGASKRAIRREMPLPDASSVIIGQLLVGKAPTPSQLLAQAELIHRVREGLSQLSELDREVLFMRTFENLSYDEIACILEIESAAARKRYGRALLRLHSILTAKGLGAGEAEDVGHD